MNNKLEKIIFKFLDEKNFLIKETPDNYYFLGNKDDKYYQIRIRKNGMVCYVYYELSEEIESFFSLTDTDSKGVLTRYVENTLNIKVFNTAHFYTSGYIVENTLNIKVFNTTLFHRQTG